MEVKELQDKAKEIVEKIDTKFNVKHDNNNTIMHLMEEVGELTNNLNKPNIRNEKIDIENLKEELGDVILLTMQIASNNNIDIEEAVKSKIEILKKRHNII